MDPPQDSTAAETSNVAGTTPVDRQFRTLLEGLRTTLPGAQVLLGFLLIVPFQTSFDGIGHRERALYQVALFSTALASVLLIAPSVHQRFRAPMSGIARNDRSHVDAAVWVSNVGTVFLGIAIVSATALVVDVIDAGPGAVVCIVALVTSIAYTWLVQPLIVFRSSSDGDAPGRGDDERL